MKNCVSVIIPVYNASKFLNATIASVLLQEETGEIILVDDDSEDNSVDIINENILKDKRIKLIRLEKNSGSANARNEGILLASMPYISFLDADDFFLANRFKNSIDLLENDSTLDGVYTKVKNVFNSNFRPAIYKHNDIIGTPKKVEPQKLFHYIMSESGDFFSIIALLLRKDVFKKVNMFDVRLRIGQDIDFTYTLTQKLRLIESNDEEIKIYRNLHDSNITSSRLFPIYNNRFKIVTKWANKCKKEKIPLKIKFVIYLRYTHHLYKNKNIEKPKIIKWLIKLWIFIVILFKSDFDKEEAILFSNKNV